MCYDSSMKKMEIERKFLLRPCSLKKFLRRHGLKYRAVPIEQFYLRSDGSGSERYRRAGNRYIHTVKSRGTLVREEREEAVDEATYRRFKARTASGVIEKIRYLVAWDDYLYELDAFGGSLQGLNVLEVEFDSLEEARSFEVPEPFSRLVIADVSEHPDFTNGALSRSMKLPVLSEPLVRILERIRKNRSDFFKASLLVEIGPYETMAHALQGILFSLLSTMETNRRALLGGEKDPERLHQFRVAIRKIRVLFNRFPEYFREEWQEKHTRKLEALMQATGVCRDLDVALEKIPEYRKMLSESSAGVIDLLERYLRGSREREEAKLRGFLKSIDVEKESSELRRFASEAAGTVFSERKMEPVLPVAAKKVKRLYRKTVMTGKRLGMNASERDYHRMRIRVKKLRYLTEFFSAIFDEKALKEWMGKLKNIQTILGEHQDLTVQRAWLRELEREDAFSGTEARRTLKALEEKLGEEAAKRRELFHAAFAEFSGGKEILRKMICRD